MGYSLGNDYSGTEHLSVGHFYVFCRNSKLTHLLQDSLGTINSFWILRGMLFNLVNVKISADVMAD